MANQLFVNPHPYGQNTPVGRWQYFQGSVVLAGSYPAGGEPLAWNRMITGLGYNNQNFAGQGITLGNGPYPNGSALITALAASGGTITATAANRFTAGQKINFVGLTSTLGLLLNGTSAVVATATPSSFTFASTATGTGTGETGMAVSGTVGNYVYSLALNGPVLTSPITNLAVSNGILTVTATTQLLPGASVVFKNLTTALGLLLDASANPFTVLANNGTTFTVATTLTGAAGADTGFVQGPNPPQPFGFIEFQSQLASGYSYAYNPINGTLHVQQGGASASAASADIAAGAYPSGVLADVISWDACFAKDR